MDEIRSCKSCIDVEMSRCADGQMPIEKVYTILLCIGDKNVEQSLYIYTKVEHVYSSSSFLAGS